jgi:hypothetical protein
LPASVATTRNLSHKKTRKYKITIQSQKLWIFQKKFDFSLSLSL